MAFDSFRPASPTPKSFRHDINGLRAWAVLAVVFYHFGVPRFSGGFIGVDVFFVISGFLMTAIIVNGLERGNLPYLCKDGRCWGDAAGRPLYSDSNYLSAFGSTLLLPMFQRAFKQAEHTEATNALQR